MDRPPVSLRAVGRTSDEVRELLAVDGIDLAGPIADLGPEYDSARVFVAPHQLGAGIPLKIIEAAAHGLPVAATQLLAQQLGWGAGELALGGDSGSAFAGAVVRLLVDDDEWTRVRAGALARVDQQYSPSVFRQSVAAAFGL